MPAVNCREKKQKVQSFSEKNFVFFALFCGKIFEFA